MNRLLASFFLASALVAQAPPGLKLGETCPPFNLPGTDGKLHGPASSTPLMVVFLGTECPYVMAMEARIDAYAKKYAGKVTVIAINPNDVAAHPEESLAEMDIQAKGRGFIFPYLKDEPQAVTRTFGAACTPDFFLFDLKQKLAYRGRLDDSWMDPSKVTARNLEAATDALLAGKPVSAEQPLSQGCSIKWKPAN